METINFRIEWLALQNGYLNGAHSISDIKFSSFQPENVLEADRTHTLRTIQNIVNLNLDKSCYIFKDMV